MSTERRRHERGSVLLLMPVAVLVVFLLGAVALDAAASFEVQRQAVADAQAVANDAASALSADALRSHGLTGVLDPDGTVPLDTGEVTRRVEADIAARRLGGTVRWWVEAGTVHVEVARRAPRILGALAGAGRDRVVRATATARMAAR